MSWALILGQHLQGSEGVGAYDHISPYGALE